MLPHDRAGHPRLREAVANRVRLVRGGVQVVPFPCMAGSTAALPSAKLAICCPADFAFTGEPWSADALAELVGWSRKHAGWLVEDDRDLDLYETGPHEAVLARGASAERTIYLGSFERSVFPEVGCGFIVAPHELVQSFSAAAQQQAYNSPLQMQRTLFDFITQGYIGASRQPASQSPWGAAQGGAGGLAQGRFHGRSLVPGRGFLPGGELSKRERTGAAGTRSRRKSRRGARACASRQA
jgi:hypothetical protein